MSADDMRLTPSLRRALEVLEQAGVEGIRPREFARAMWPDSDGWKRSAGGSHHSHRGGGMYSAGGAYLGKMHNAGLTWHTRRGPFDTGHALTEKGRQMLAQARETED